eukprot:6789145-Pyramimonas_sp.AAC.1
MSKRAVGIARLMGIMSRFARRAHELVARTAAAGNAAVASITLGIHCPSVMRPLYRRGNRGH